MTSIACSFDGCNRAVIGQCPGYKNKCGRNYCSYHSQHKLCADCGHEKQLDITYNEYIQMCVWIDSGKDRIQKEVTKAPLGLVGNLVGVALLVFGFASCISISALSNPNDSGSTNGASNAIFTTIIFICLFINALYWVVAK